LFHQELKTNAFLSQKRDIFFKQYGFSMRTPSLLQKEDQICTYFYYTSMDSADSKAICPEQVGVERTHLYFGMSKYEYVMVREQEEDEEIKESDDQVKQPNMIKCVKITALI
jgi:hypothetical protein